MEGPRQAPWSRSLPLLGGLWVFGVSPRPAADTRPLLLKPRRPATLGGALPKVPTSGQGLGQLPGGRQPPSGAGGTVTVCSSPRLPEGGLRGRHCVQHGQRGTLALVSRETWRTDFKLRETAYRTKTFVQSHLGVSPANPRCPTEVRAARCPPHSPAVTESRTARLTAHRPASCHPDEPDS